MALSNPDFSGSRTYLLKERITLKRTRDGDLTGPVEVRREFVNRAVIRIFTYTIDGRSQMVGPTAGARYYDIPLRKFLKKAPLAASPQSPSFIASPPASTLSKGEKEQRVKGYFHNRFRLHHPNPANPVKNNANDPGSGTAAVEERLATRKPMMMYSNAGLTSLRADDDRMMES